MYKFGYYDIFLVESNSDNIIYSAAKELDYATSLKTGAYAQTGIGEVFKAANAAEKADTVVISDYSAYPASYLDQAAFIGSPIFQRGRKIGVLIFQLQLEKISKIMSHNKAWQDVGLGNSGQSYLVGNDMTMRSENRILIESPEQFFTIIEKSGISSVQLQQLKNKRNSTGILPIK